MANLKTLDFVQSFALQVILDSSKNETAMIMIFFRKKYFKWKKYWLRKNICNLCQCFDDIGRILFYVSNNNRRLRKLMINVRFNNITINTLN